MPEPPSRSPRTPDVRTIHQLVRMMQRYGLTAIDLIEGETKIRLRRRTEVAGVPTAPAAPAMAPVAPPLAPPSSAPKAEAPTSSAADLVIESPMVGTFYAASAPDAPPFVAVGSPVRPETIVCVIEAMKVFTDIPAGVSGTVAEVLVKNGQPVEFGQPLFRVTPA